MCRRARDQNSVPAEATIASMLFHLLLRRTQRVRQAPLPEREIAASLRSSQ
jgi:hypothetical protein